VTGFENDCGIEIAEVPHMAASALLLLLAARLLNQMPTFRSYTSPSTAVQQFSVVPCAAISLSVKTGGKSGLGVTAFDAIESAELPMALVATTLKV
jgi:hypothetical protein